jgi:hypothetical protein
MTSLTYRRYCLDMQGYCALDDAAKARIDLGQRFKPAVCAALAIPALILQSVPLALLAAAVGWWAAILPYHPADLFYQAVLRRFGAPDLGAEPTPRRFACAMAASLLLVGAAGFGLGAPVVGLLFVGMAAVALAVQVLGGFCIGAFFYWLLVRRRIFRGNPSG